MIHTNLPQNCMVFLLLYKLPRLVINFMGVNFDTHKSPTLLVDEVRGQLRNFE